MQGNFPSIERSRFLEAVSASPRASVVSGWFPFVRCWLAFVVAFFLAAAFGTLPVALAFAAFTAALCARVHAKTDYVVAHRFHPDGLELVHRRAGRRMLSWESLRGLRVGVDCTSYVLCFEGDPGEVLEIPVTGLRPVVHCPDYGREIQIA